MSPFDYVAWKAALLAATPATDRAAMAAHADRCIAATTAPRRPPADDEPVDRPGIVWVPN